MHNRCSKKSFLMTIRRSVPCTYTPRCPSLHKGPIGFRFQHRILVKRQILMIEASTHHCISPDSGADSDVWDCPVFHSYIWREVNPQCVTLEYSPSSDRHVQWWNCDTIVCIILNCKRPIFYKACLICCCLSSIDPPTPISFSSNKFRQFWSYRIRINILDSF